MKLYLPWLVAFALAAVISVMATFGYYFRINEGVWAWSIAAGCALGLVVSVLRREAHRRSRRQSEASRQAMGLLTWSYEDRASGEDSPLSKDVGWMVLIGGLRIASVVVAIIGLLTSLAHCPGYENEGVIYLVGSVAVLVGGQSLAGWLKRRDPDPVYRALKRTLTLAKDGAVTWTAAGLILGYRARAWSGVHCRLIRAGLVSVPVRGLELEFLHWKLFRETLVLPLPDDFHDEESLLAMLQAKIDGRRVDWGRINQEAPSPK